MEQQRSIGESSDGSLYELDDWFVESIREFSIADRSHLLKFVLSSLDCLPVNNAFTQVVGGVIIKDDPLFFILEFLKQEDETAVLLSIEEIPSDEYLDLILDKTTFKYYKDGKARRRNKKVKKNN
jgi:hypothetical protein